MESKIYVTRAGLPNYEEYIAAIKPLWDTHLITNMGSYHNELEVQLKDYLSVPYISLMVNGHMALELAIQVFDFPQGSEIITTPFTFISTTHAIVRNGLKPVFCDVKEDGTIDESKIESLITEKTVAIMPVHVYGHACAVENIEKIAYKYSLKVIYDAAHAFGVKYKGKGIGNFGDAACFSFHATKLFNTIEGGAVTFSEPKMYEKLYNLKNFGIRGEELVVAVGANAKMNEFAAIMGICNLKRINETIERRRKISECYDDWFSDTKGIKTFPIRDDVEYNYAYYPIVVNEDYRLSRDELYDFLKNNNIYARKYFYPLTSNQACFKNKYRDVDLKNANDLAERILTLPLYEDLTDDEVERIAKLIHG